MKTSRKLLVVSLLVGALSLTGCVRDVPPAPTHKVKTTACLISSGKEVPGSPENQIANDLVEAKVIFGLNVREVSIKKELTDFSTSLLKALQGGCVLMISSNELYLDALAKFAGEHPKMLVLFIGGAIPEERQPTNFRWVADDAVGGAKLAGYLAAAKAETGELQLLVQPSYFQAKAITAAFRAGVKDYERSANKDVQVRYSKIKTSEDLSAKLANLVAADVAMIFAGLDVWQGFSEPTVDAPFVIGANLKPGSSAETVPFVQVSLERNVSGYIFDAVSSLLSRKVSSQPAYRKPDALKQGTNDLSVLIPDSVDGTLLDALALYKQELVSSATR